MKRYIQLPILTGMALLAGLSSAACRDPDGTCILGAFPHTTPRQIEDTYSTIAEELSLVLDREVILRTASDVDHFLRHLEKQEYDIVLAGLGHYLMVAEPVGYAPLARRSNPLHYLIITRGDAPFRNTRDLRGHRFGFMPPANGTTISSHLLLRKAGLDYRKDLQDVRYASQQACIHSLMSGLVDACGLAEPIVQVFQEQLGTHFKILTRTRDPPNVAHLASPNLSHEQRDALRDYFSSREGFQAANARDYEHVRSMLREHLAAYHHQ